MNGKTIQPERSDNVIDYWLNDDFEESIVCLLLSSIERRLVKNRNCPPAMRINGRDIGYFLKKGAYLPGKSREIIAPNEKIPFHQQLFRFEVDKYQLPSIGCHGMSDVNKNVAKRLEKEGTRSFNGYSYIGLFSLVDKLPNGWCRFGGGCIFKLSILALTDKGLDGHTIYLTVSQDGYITACDYTTPMSRGVSGKKESWYSIKELEPKLLKDAEQELSFSLQFEVDKCNSWTITAEEDGGIVTLGVEQEEIKSLLYARSLPITRSGRKRPILHLVESHKRRLKNGTEIDISSFLRGMREVFIGNTRFTVNKPYNLSLDKVTPKDTPINMGGCI